MAIIQELTPYNKQKVPMKVIKSSSEIKENMINIPKAIPNIPLSTYWILLCRVDPILTIVAI